MPPGFLLPQLRVLLGWGLLYIFYDRLQGPMSWPALSHSHSHSHSIRLQPMRVCDRVGERRLQKASAGIAATNNDAFCSRFRCFSAPRWSEIAKDGTTSAWGIGKRREEKAAPSVFVRSELTSQSAEWRRQRMWRKSTVSDCNKNIYESGEAILITPVTCYIIIIVATAARAVILS